MGVKSTSGLLNRLKFVFKGSLAVLWRFRMASHHFAFVHLLVSRAIYATDTVKSLFIMQWQGIEVCMSPLSTDKIT